MFGVSRNQASLLVLTDFGVTALAFSPFWSCHALEIQEVNIFQEEEANLLSNRGTQSPDEASSSHPRSRENAFLSLSRRSNGSNSGS